MSDRPTAEDDLRAQVRAELARANLSQAEACRQLGVSTKHLNMMLKGHAPLTLPWAEKILALTGARVLVHATVPPGQPDRVLRKQIDQMDDDQLDALYDELDRAHEVIGELNETITRRRRRATRRTR